jgi:tetrahydromethanopterin S-methyltransferase subunit B
LESEIARRLLNNCEKGWIIPRGLDRSKQVSNHGKHRNNLYYLLPGMGHGARKRFWRNLLLGVLVGLLVSGLMAFLFWLTYR